MFLSTHCSHHKILYPPTFRFLFPFLFLSLCDLFEKEAFRVARLFLHFLNEKVKHLGLDKVLDKLTVGFGLSRLAEVIFLEHGRLSTGAALYVRREVAYGLHEEGKKSLRYHSLQLLWV